jgi:glycosyltransferase involved in cell wall biosynthesis
VLHVITRMIVGGAQENTMLSCALIDHERFPSTIVCGPETGSEGSLLEESRVRGIEVVIEPDLVRRPHPVRDVRVVGKLARFMREGEFDVVHTHTSKAGILGRIAARRARVPVIIHTAHGWAFTRRDWAPVRELWVHLERRQARGCDAIVVVGREDERAALERKVGRPDQYRLIRSGIELESFRNPGVSREAMRAELVIGPGAFVVGTVGRLSRQKAPLELVAAFVELSRAHAGAELVLVGDGPQRGPVERAIAAAGITARVHLLGLRRDVPRLLRALDVFALSSRWEGLPRVVPQAMAAGLPVVATRVGAVEDAVLDGETGVLVAPGDPAALAARLLELARDPRRALVMGERGRDRAEEFSAQSMTRQLEALYTECVERHAAKLGMPAARG